MWKAFSALKFKAEFKPRADNLVFRLHYRYTFLLFMAGAILTTLYDFVGKKIDCMMTFKDDDELKAVVNSYCYITGTYTVDKLHYGEVGKDMPHPGVGPHDEETDAVTYHTWYQWVPFVLVAQGTLFYLPHLIWKRCESGLFRSIIQNLSIKDYLDSKKGDKQNMSNYFNRADQFKSLSVYLTDYSEFHTGWAAKFLVCELLNIVVTVSTMVFTNSFLGGEFYEYGLNVFAISDMDPENRTDPMAQVFPRMGKCTFRMFGPSGTIERRDVMCLLPTNIANEKIYMVMWFWLAILLVIGSFWILIRILSLVRVLRNKYFMVRYYDIPRWYTDEYQPLVKLLATREEINLVLETSTFSDYLFLSQLSNTMETYIFCEFVKSLAEYRQTADDKRVSSDSGLDDEISLNKTNTFPMSERGPLLQPDAYPALAPFQDHHQDLTSGQVSV